CWDPLDANILNCDERQLVNKNATVKIGSFAAGMVWQPVCPAAGDLPANPREHCNDGCTADSPNGRLFLGVRGNSSITFVDVSRTAGWSDIQMSCNAPGAVFAECDADHQLDTSINTIGSLTAPPPPTDPTTPPTPPTTVHLPDEPYALALDGQRQ